MRKLRVEVWSDIACPWCWVGKRRLEAALARFEHRNSVEVLWRAFELDPSAPRVREPRRYAERLADKYGRPLAQAQQMIDNMTSVAAADGLSFDFERIQPGNTFDAHRLLHLASERGLQDALKERFFRGYMSEGQAIGDHDVLARLAVEVGLDAAEVADVLASDSHASHVRADEDEARSVGVRGVPFFVIGRYGVSGAQPSDVLERALERAWEEADEQPALAEGAACGPDGC